MDITLENISMATVRKLMDQAAASGLTVEAYLQRLLTITIEAPQTTLAITPEEHTNAFMADMETLAEGTDHPSLASLTYSREDIYFDHD